MGYSVGPLLTIMEPHQKHFRAKMRKHGWMDEAEQMIWPSDVEGREKMARGLFGYELVKHAR